MSDISEVDILKVNILMVNISEVDILKVSILMVDISEVNIATSGGRGDTFSGRRTW
jgi:hypothetical protein